MAMHFIKITWLEGFVEDNTLKFQIKKEVSEVRGDSISDLLGSSYEEIYRKRNCILWTWKIKLPEWCNKKYYFELILRIRDWDYVRIGKAFSLEKAKEFHDKAVKTALKDAIKMFDWYRVGKAHDLFREEEY